MERACRLVIVAGGVLVAAVAQAGEPPPAHGASGTVRGFVAWLDSPARSDTGNPFIQSSKRIDDGSGWGLGLEYRLSSRIGVEAIGLVANLEGSFRVERLIPPDLLIVATGPAELEAQYFGVALNVHLLPERRVDVYAGPLVTIARYGEFEGQSAGGSLRIDFSDGTALGVGAGIDVPVRGSPTWTFCAGARRLWATARAGDLELDLDPWIATAGVAYRW